jgi:hypothetical protein
MLTGWYKVEQHDADAQWFGARDTAASAHQADETRDTGFLLARVLL